MTDSFGARLRRERERRQITLPDIAARTKIKASLFEEIERNDASHWPTGIFRRSFMRAYADAVGLDAEATVREFLERFPDPAAPPPIEPPKTAAPAPIVAAVPLESA
jgi:cytoskeletal protein RodZ